MAITLIWSSYEWNYNYYTWDESHQKLKIVRFGWAMAKKMAYIALDYFFFASRKTLPLGVLIALASLLELPLENGA